MLPSTPATTKTQKKISEYLSWLGAFGYSFRLNEITGQQEINGKPLTDDLFLKIQSQLIEKGCTSERYARVAIGASAYDNKYNPIIDYLSKLSYDGSNYFDQVSACFDNPDGLFPLYLRKWMLGAISKVTMGTQNRLMIIDGPQDIGKSKFVSWLCSGLKDYFTEGPIDPDQKDTLIRLTTKWIWEVGEIGSTFRKSDREALKNIITTQTITFRRPYGRYDETKPAIASLFGTVNNEGGLLDDPTGSRRFMICRVEKVDWERYLPIDVNKLWGEIYAAFLIGESWEFTKDEKKRIEKNNREYEIEDPIELVLRDQFNIDPLDKSIWTSTIEITYTLQDHNVRYSSPKGLQMSLAATCKKLGLEKCQRNNQKGYFGISKKGMLP